MTKILCIYHANCADGLGAAWAVHRALGNGVEFVAASYGDDTDEQSNFAELRGRDVLIVDFSYPLATLRAMAQEARSVLVLDHHKTAQEDLGQILSIHPGTFDYKNWTSSPVKYNLGALFDMDRSGAGLAWDYLHPGAPRPRIINLIEDRDLWRFRFGDETRAFHAVLASYDWTDLEGMFERLDNWIMWYGQDEYSGLTQWDSLLAEGHAILRAQSQLVASTVAASRRPMRIAGHVVPCANVPPSMASEAGELLCEQSKGAVNVGEGHLTMWGPISAAFSATYYDGADGRRHFSLRSPESGVDVGAIAQRIAANFNRRDWQTGKEGREPWSGGGHEHAAGFDTPLNWTGE